MTDLIVETPDVELDVDGVAVIGGASYTAGAGIDITNNVISVDDTVALNSDVVHKTGDEIINGTKTFENQSIFIGETNGCDAILVGNGVVAMGIGAYGISEDGDTENHGFIAFPDTTEIPVGEYKTFATTDDIPTQTSQLENNSGFITNSVDNLTNYRTSLAQDSIDGTKQPLITSSNKLSSDLVDDTDHTNKFVSATDISNWNAKAEVSQIPTNVSQLNNDSGYLTLGTLPIYNGGVQ